MASMAPMSDQLLRALEVSVVVAATSASQWSCKTAASEIGSAWFKSSWLASIVQLVTMLFWANSIDPRCLSSIVRSIGSLDNDSIAIDEFGIGIEK